MSEQEPTSLPPPERLEGSTNDTNRYVVRLRLIAQAVVRLKEARHALRKAEEAVAAAETQVDATPGARGVLNALVATEGQGDGP